MDFNVGRDYKHYGDNIEKGGKKYVYGSDLPTFKPLTETELKRKVDAVKPEITSGTMWYSVCKYMMWRHMCAERNFKRACEILMKLYPDLELNSKKIKDLDVGTLRGELDDWEYECGLPFKDEDVFEQYKFIAVRLYEA